MNSKTMIDRAGFISGVGYAVARLVEMHDQPTMAAEIIKESGYALGDFAEVCEPRDMEFIKIAWNS